MARPCKARKVICHPRTVSFKPDRFGPGRRETIALTKDEFEAIRLADFEGLYQEQAAAKMKISRQTFGNIIGAAHNKIADFLINAKRLTVQGGSIEIKECCFICRSCRHVWTIPCSRGKPGECPECKSAHVCCSKKFEEGKHFQKCWRNV